MKVEEELSGSGAMGTHLSYRRLADQHLAFRRMVLLAG